MKRSIDVRIKWDGDENVSESAAFKIIRDNLSNAYCSIFTTIEELPCIEGKVDVVKKYIDFLDNKHYPNSDLSIDILNLLKDKIQPIIDSLQRRAEEADEAEMKLRTYEAVEVLTNAYMKGVEEEKEAERKLKEAGG